MICHSLLFTESSRMMVMMMNDDDDDNKQQIESERVGESRESRVEPQLDCF